ncbi:MAG: radical SAM/B12 binding domain protein [Parcubacteria group bacterium Gr01-1014_29]|nr:MAG: radical SAM/B12 binding domain protein [Parcubacteria group bacterium Gr01-1014_29]
MKRKIIITNLPGGSPWHKDLGTAWLNGVLRNEGHEVILRDAHILGLEYVLREHDPHKADPENSLLERALCMIRDPKSGPADWYLTRRTFEDISRSIITPDTFSVARNNVHYISAYYDGTIEQACEAINNREKHLFYDYYAQVEVPLAQKFNPDIYGISVSADERQIIQGLILASLIKEALPNTLVVLGGNIWSRVMSAFTMPLFASFFDRSCDAIVCREGFEPFKELAATLNPSRASGTVWRRKSGEIIVNPPTKTPVRFNTLPAPIFERTVQQWCPDVVLPFQTSQNCTMQCEFCSISAGSDTFLKSPLSRSMSPTHIAENIAKLGVHRIDFVDELLPIKKQIALGEELKRIGYEATWQCYTTITDDFLDPEICRKLYNADLRKVQMGLESLSPETLKRENKRWNRPDHYGQCIINLWKAGIQVHIFIIVGLPGEPLFWSLLWLPFLERYGDFIMTIKAGRYRPAKMSPEVETGLHSASIELLPDNKPLHTNRDFRYLKTSMKRVEAMLTLVEQACREHTFYQYSSTYPWWANRGRHSNAEIQEIAASLRLLGNESPAPHLDRAIKKLPGIIQDELGQKVTFRSFEDVQKFARTIEKIVKDMEDKR